MRLTWEYYKKKNIHIVLSEQKNHSFTDFISIYKG